MIINFTKWYKMRVKDGRGVGVCLFVSQFICLLLLLFLLMNYASKRVQAMCAHEREREGGGEIMATAKCISEENERHYPS